ncbi:MAG: poly-beta-1,6-N-acetyl-D-glucosamine biosynthesis protein PgaD [Pseudomonadota bacterium]
MSRNRADEDLIIRKPELQNNKARWAYRFLSIVFWLLFLLTIGAWVLSFWWAGKQLGNAANFLGDLSELKFLAIMMLILGGGLIVWAVYNWIRFRGEDRRRHRVPVNPEGLAQYFDSTAIDLFLMHGSQRIVLHLDDEGRITQYDISLPGDEPVIIRAEHGKGPVVSS